MNKKSIIGLILIFGIFVGYMFWVAPSKEELAERQRVRDSIMAAFEDSVAYADSMAKIQAELDSLAKAGDTTAQRQMQMNQRGDMGAFNASAFGDTINIVVKNEKMSVDISNMGAQVREVVLKDYTTYDSMPLQLITPADDNMNLIFSTEESRVINTRDLVFVPYIEQNKQLVQITKVDSAVSNAMIYGYGTRQLFMSLVTKLLPWHFQLNEEQMKVVRDIASKIIQDNGLTQIEDIFEDIMSEHGMIAKVQEKKLAKMGERILERRTSYIRNELNDNEAQYDRLYSQLMDYGARIRENRLQLAAIENSNGEFENPIKEMQQFMADCAHEFKLARVEGNEIYLECKMPLVDYTDEEYYRASIKEGTRSSAFIRYFDNYADYDEDTIREAYKHIMETRDCTVWTCCQIVVDMYDFELTVRNEINREHAMRHPHLNTSLRCFGTASPD